MYYSLFIKRTYHAKEEVDNIMKVFDNFVRFQFSIMCVMHSSLKGSSIYIIAELAARAA